MRRQIRRKRTHYERQSAAIREGVREADQGRLLSHKRLKAKWLKRLATAQSKAQ